MEGACRGAYSEQLQPRSQKPECKEDITHLPPDQLAAGITEKEKRIAEIMANICSLLSKHRV